MSSDETVALSFASVDYANNIYINGELIQSVGIPGTSAETAVPMTTRVYYTVKPVDGVIEIVNQISNFVHAEGGSFSGVYIGTIDSMSMHYARQAHGTTITLGICLLLFLVHTILFMLQRSYKANIFFAVFSLVLFMRTGVTGMKILMLVFPRMSWYFSFRVEYLSLPLGCLLIVLALAGMFKRLLPKPVIIASIIVNSIESVLIVFIPTVLMTKALPLLQFTIIVSLIFIVVRFFMLLSRERSSEYIIALCALIFVVYATVREILMHLDILIFPMINNGMLDLAILVFTIFLLTASFLGTIREIDAAKQNEQRLEIENAALASVNSLKTELMTTVSHELRTPLAVIMGYAQLITREAAASGISNRAMTDIDSIVSETKRLTRIVDEMQRVVLARVEGPGTPVSLADVVQRVAKIIGDSVGLTIGAFSVVVPVHCVAVVCLVCFYRESDFQASGLACHCGGAAIVVGINDVVAAVLFAVGMCDEGAELFFVGVFAGDSLCCQCAALKTGAGCVVCAGGSGDVLSFGVLFALGGASRGDDASGCYAVVVANRCAVFGAFFCVLSGDSFKSACDVVVCVFFARAK